MLRRLDIPFRDAAASDLAWSLLPERQGGSVITIPGTTNLEHLAENARAATSPSSMVRPWNTTWAPYPRVAFSLGIGAPSGMNTVAVVPSSRAASATPCAWLPALAATTPRLRSTSVSREIRL